MFFLCFCFFDLFFPCFFCFSYHFWPTPLLAFFCDRTVLCPNLCEPSLTPKNLSQWDCSSGQIVARDFFFGPWTSLCAGSPQVLCCGVSYGVAHNFRGCVQDLGASTDSLSTGPPPPTPLRRTAQNFAPFFPSPTLFALSVSLSGGLFVEFWWCLKRRCQLCTFGLTGCRVKPGGFLQNVRNNLTIDLPLHNFRKNQ